VHLVGFIVGAYHDARSSGCQILYLWLNCVVYDTDERNFD